MSSRLRLAVASALLAATAGAAAQGADLPLPPRVGDRFVIGSDTLFDAPCREWTVTGTGAEIEMRCGEYRVVNAANADYNLIGAYGPGGTRLLTADPHFPFLDFPLRVGKTWTGAYDGYRGTLHVGWKSNVECLVDGYEDGDHPLFRIVCDDTFWAVLVVVGTHRSTFWYSPELGRVVRQQHHQDASSSWHLAGW